MDSKFHNQYSIGIKIYIITLLFTALSIFLQLVPLDTSNHFQEGLLISSCDFIYLSSLFFVSYSIMQLPGGLLLDKYGIKYILPISITITLISILMYWSSTSEWMLGISRIIAGIGCSVAYISGIYVAANFFPASRLPLLIGLIEASSTIGSLVAANPLKYALNKFGWHVTGMIIIAFTLIVCISSFYFVKKIKCETRKHHVSFVSSVKQSFLLFKNKTFLYVVGYSFCTWLVIMSFAGYWLKDYMIVMHKYTEETSLHLIEMYWGSFLTASLGISYFIKTDRLAVINLLWLAIIGFVTYFVMSIPVLFSYSQIMLVVVLGGISATGVILSFSLIPRLVDVGSCGTAVAINNTFVVLGGYVGQVLFGITLKYINVNTYMNIITDPSINQYHYSALLIYLLFTLLGLFFAILIFKNIRNKLAC